MTLAPSPPANPSLIGAVPDELELAARGLQPTPTPPKRVKWLETAREKQLTPEGVWWFVWLILAGRGFGKTRTGSEHTAQFGRENPGAEIGVIGRTDAEARRLLLNGPSGLLSVLEPWELDRTKGAGKGFIDSPGDSRIFLANGAIIYVTGANSPDALRGLNLWMAWADELAAWRYQQTLWDEVLEPAVRIGPHPHIIVTTTPRPTKLIRTLLKDAMATLTRGSTFENAANLSRAFIRRMKRKYEGSRTGRQELHAEVLEDVPGALVTADTLEASRVEAILEEDGTLTLPPSAKLEGYYREAVIGLDPSDGTEEGDEQGIALVGLGWDHELYIEHTDGLRESAYDYLAAAVDMAVEHRATIVVEKNHGGAYLVATLDQVMKDKGVVVPVVVVKASDGKRTRAEPIVPLFTRKKLHFVGNHGEVEDQLTTWTGAKGEKSPDRMDALVWAVTYFLRHTLAVPDETEDAGAYSYAQQADKADWAEDDDDEVYDFD